MAGLLDGVIIKFSKGIKSSDHMVVVEGIHRSVTKHEDAPEHGGRETADGCLDRILNCLLVCLFVFEVVVALANLDDVTTVVEVLFIVGLFILDTDSRVVEVITAGAPSTAPGLIGLKVLTGYKSFMRALLMASGYRGVRSRSGGQLSNRRVD